MELTLKNLTKSYGSFIAVSELNYTMRNGVYGLLGVNGAGKTTLMRMICTLMKPTQGCITCDGRDIFEMGGEYRRLIGYLPQEFGYYPDLSAREYLMYIAAIKGLRTAVAKERTEKLLEKVGLGNTGEKRLKSFSGGMIRRIGIAQAVLNDPKILVLDEPTAGLDPKERIRFRNLISELAPNCMVLISTHIVSDLEFIPNKIVLMQKGKFAFSGTPEEIVDSISDKVWSCKIERNELEKYTKLFSVASVKSASKGLELRIISETKPDSQAEKTRATLEDAFLFYFGEKAGEI